MLEVDVVGHAVGVVVEVCAEALERLAVLALEIAVCAEPVQRADHDGDLAAEQALRLYFDEGSGVVAAVGMEQ